MPSNFDVTVRLSMSRKDLWRVRASKTFMDFLVRNGALQRMETTAPERTCSPTSTTARTAVDQELTRKQVYVPGNVVISEMIRSIVDDSYIEITDEQKWSESNPFVQESQIRPSILGDIIATNATLYLNPDEQEDDCCWHTLKGSVSVPIMFLGYYVEQAVISNMRSFYDAYPRHIDEFVAFVTHKFGDGSRASLPASIDKMLKREHKLV